MNSEKGIAHIVALIVLVLGLGAGLYLVSHPTILRPRAQEVSSVPSFPPPIISSCKARIGNFSLGQPCDEVENGFRIAKYSCLGEITISRDEVQSEGDSSSCKSAEEWVRIASNKCQSFCPIPTPQISQIPVPTIISYQCNSDSDCAGGKVCQKSCNVENGNCETRCVSNYTPPPYASTPTPLPGPYSISPTPSYNWHIPTPPPQRIYTTPAYQTPTYTNIPTPYVQPSPTPYPCSFPTKSCANFGCYPIWLSCP